MNDVLLYIFNTLAGINTNTDYNKKLVNEVDILKIEYQYYFKEYENCNFIFRNIILFFIKHCLIMDISSASVYNKLKTCYIVENNIDIIFTKTRLPIIINNICLAYKKNN